MSKLHDKVNRNRMTQYARICIYTYISGGIGTRRRSIRLEFCCGTAFFARRAQYKDAGASWGNDRERETDTKVAGCIEAKHVHVSRHRPIYIIICIIHIFGLDYRLERFGRDEKSFPKDFLPEDEPSTLFMSCSLAINARLSSVKPRVRVALMSNRCEYI